VGGLNSPSTGGVRTSSQGGILVDALVGLLIAAIAFALILGQLSLTARAALRWSSRVAELIENRNEESLDRTVEFSPAHP
jgi:hypothetical protein